MSRFHLTSSEADHAAAENISKESGLSSLGEKSELGYHIQTYQKRAINNTNFVEIEDDWICSAGTLIRNGSVGKKPIKEMYNFLTEGGIKTARQKFVGHYAIAVKLGDEIHIFTDPHGAHQLYYTKPDLSSYIISNSLHTVGCCFDSTKVNPLRAIHYAVQSREIGPKSFFKDVYRLYGSQCINIDISEGKMSIHDFDMSVHTLSNNASIQDAVKEYADLLRDVFNQVKGVDSVALNTTGGLDTRTILAGTLDRGINPLLIYGVGNSRLTNTKRSDLRIAKKLSEQFDLPFYRMDWSGQHPHGDEKNLANFKKFGFKYMTYGSADSLLKELGGGISPYPRLQLSGYGPALSNSAPWEYPKKEYSIEDLVELLSQDLFYSESFIRTEEYENYLTQEIQTALDHTGIEYPDTGATLSSLVQAQTFLRVRAAAGMLNFANEFNYFFAPFMMKRLHDPLVTVPMEFRSKDEFQVRLTHLLNEDTLKNTVFSGIEPQKIDLDTYTMKNPKPYNLKQTALSNASLLIPEILLPTAKRLYNHLNTDPDDDMSINKEIRNSSSGYILENDLTSGYIKGTEHFGLRNLNKLHRVLFGIDKIIDGNVCEK